MSLTWGGATSWLLSLRPGSGAKSPGFVRQGGRGGWAPGLWRIVPTLGSPQAAQVCVPAAAMPSARANSVAGTEQAGPLECRVLGKAGHSGCCEANLASIKASFRAAKPFPYVSLWELQSAGEGMAGRHTEVKWPHPSALHQPVVWLAREWVPDLRAEGWRAQPAWPCGEGGLLGRWGSSQNLTLVSPTRPLSWKPG